MNKLFLLIAGAGLLTACNNQPQAMQPSSADEVNDVNTPLHMLQPDYDYPYGVPDKAEVKAVMDRVLSYTSEAMPASVDAEGRLVQGKMRLTTYESGVTYAAALSAYTITGDSAYLRFVDDRCRVFAELAPQVEEKLKQDPHFDPQMRRVVAPSAMDDAGSQAAALIRLQMNGQHRDCYDALIERYVDYVMNKEVRLKDGTFARHRPHRNTVWLDDMYMGVPSLAWYGSYKNDPRYTAEAVRQIRLFKDKMWVPERQLFRHGWVEEMNPHPAFHWGRANGWAILTMCEVMDNLDYAIAHGNTSIAKDREFVLELLRQHIDGLCRLQHHTGMWHQLLDRNDTYLESSCTAIYTYCMAHAINKGWIDPLAYGAQVFLAWNSLTGNVNEKGQVINTCVGTGMGFDPAFYAYRPVNVMAAHGYGPLLWAGAEIIKLVDSTWPKLNDAAVHLYHTEQKTNDPIFSEGMTGEIF